MENRFNYANKKFIKDQSFMQNINFEYQNFYFYAEGNSIYIIQETYPELQIH